ncbi:hypothetical protein ACVNS2_35960 [Paenibacillus caseinilyticus]|uniref:Sporulation protein n=1 Tax=Paenibacillus mucilaginosus K02 TaxID=997761 RepID=I0BUN8_9BACL|nr:hypothetical protein [Paenibacillus mucilaginosus]AFH66085.1 hypothetical protein B2K_36190 [Paenibacillus mucilaginosus K02]
MSRAVILVSLTAAMLVMPTAACQRQDTVQVKQHSRDGLLGITDTNPNNPMSRTYRHYPDDLRVMREAIVRRFPQVQDTRISLNGTMARVRLFVPAEMTAEERDRLRQDAAGVLAYEAPRYEAEVDVTTK